MRRGSFIRCSNSEAGSVETLSVISDPLLRNAAVDAVLQWEWKPYTLNGKPTKVETIVTLNFTLLQ